MDRQKQLLRFWRFYNFILRLLARLKLNYTHEVCDVEGPCMVISNHVTNWDPILVASSFRKKHLHFVANERIFRNPIMAWIFTFFVEPIARRKGTTGADTVMTCLRKIRAGGSICLFAEGDTSWDGVNIDIFPATGKMVRSSGAKLVTYRIEGGYLTLPRWGKKVRRGKIHGHVVGVYSPEELKAMKPGEINDLINRDIHEDAWERQRREHIVYKGRNLAEGMEKALFVCPGCKRLDTLMGAGNRISCSCGFSLKYTPEGFFDPPEPFETVREWNLWQNEIMEKDGFVHDESLFSDNEVSLWQLPVGEKDVLITKGRLTQLEDRLVISDREFMLSDISSMGIFKSSTLLFTVGTDYFQLHADAVGGVRKYLVYWQVKHRK